MAKEVGLNIGSGQRPFRSTQDLEWVNVDSQLKWKPDLLADGAHLEDFCLDDSIDYVVLHHVLEHFGCGEGAALIREAHRVLKPGGSLFVCVPNLLELARGWINGKIDTQIYVTNLYGAYMGSEDDRHKWGFDQQSLWRFLFESATWRGGPYLPANYPDGADIARDWWILEMQVIK